MRLSISKIQLLISTKLSPKHCASDAAEDQFQILLPSALILCNTWNTMTYYCRLWGQKPRPLHFRKELLHLQRLCTTPWHHTELQRTRRNKSPHRPARPSVAIFGTAGQVPSNRTLRGAYRLRLPQHGSHQISEASLWRISWQTCSLPPTMQNSQDNGAKPSRENAPYHRLRGNLHELLEYMAQLLVTNSQVFHSNLLEERRSSSWRHWLNPVATLGPPIYVRRNFNV